MPQIPLFFQILLATVTFASLGNESKCPPRDSFPEVSALQSNVETVLAEEILMPPLVFHPQTAAIYGEDNRIFPNMSIYPYRTMGRLLTYEDVLNEDDKIVSQQYSPCSATLVSECHLLTAGHCVRESSEFPIPFLRRKKMHKKITGYQFEDSTGLSHAAEKVISGPSSRVEDDYAFVKLETNPGKKLGFMGILRKSSAQYGEGDPLIVSGFSMDLKKGRRLSSDETAVVGRKSFNPKILWVRGDSHVGSSGGPTWTEADNNVPIIVGINSQTRLNKISHPDGSAAQITLDDDEKSELATMLTTEAFYTALRKFMKENPCD